MELLIFVLLAYLLFSITFKRKDNDNDIEVLDHKSTTCIKGMLSIFVLIHNLGLDYLQTLSPDGDFTGKLWIVKRVVEYIGGIAVGVFFFLSAYGILTSYKKNGNKFLIKLFFKNTIKLWLIAVSINLLEYLAFFKNAFERKDAILRILNLDLFNHYNRMNRHGWFIATLLALYIVFIIIYFLSSLLKTEKKLKIASYIMASVPIGFFVFTLIKDNGGMYSREVWCFSLGIIYGLYKEKINVFLKKHYNLFFILSIVAYFIGLILQEETASGALCLFFVMASFKYDFKSPVSLFIGKISLGIYLFLHFSTIVLSSAFQTNVWYWMLINSGFIFMLSVILYFVVLVIEKLISKIINFKENKV